MLVLTFTLAIILLLFFVCRKPLSKKLQTEYEKNLLNGNKKMALKTGRIYYNTLDAQKKKAKGVISIDRKIVEDFKAFNVMRLI